MGVVRNILFVMYDQLRWDYLSCAGHPHLATPNFDRLAALGLRFTRAYVQSPVCGASRMSFYTGRYVHSHGAAGNNFPLRVGEITLGEHLRDLGAECWLVGKTHMKVDARGMARLGLAPDSIIGARVAEAGFDVWEREDGLVCEGPEGRYPSPPSPYNAALAARGYPGANPWHDFANSGIDEAGDIASGWLMANARRPANIAEADSETAWLTDRALDFLRQKSGAAAPWLCHVSYIKPHWPYIVPEPWASRYGPQHVVPAVRHPAERSGAHPVYAAFMDNPIGRTFARDEVRAEVIPAYMGLVAQCDAHFGRLLDHLEATGEIAHTMIVLTSDHGDYLGDHWLGEKELFHDQSVRVPLIVFDPSAAADATRGRTCDALVESIDLAATFIDAMGGSVPRHIVEGRSLLPLLRGDRPADWRRAVFSEYDYSATQMAARLGIAPAEARLFMVCDGRWKMMHAEGGFRPMLFDLVTDPQELVDLGGDPAHAGAIAALYDQLAAWARRGAQRITVTDDELVARRGRTRGVGVLIGVWDAGELDPALHPFIGHGRKAPADYREPLGPQDDPAAG
jgi:arylsulfatase A-like enzyme